jgi:sucrose-6-phosphate hydrolase SacC (GH32 family)
VDLRYDIENNRFHGMQQRKGRLGPEKEKVLKPDADGILKIRLLVDWAQLEVFSAGGVFSYTAHLGFTPGDSSLGLSAKGGEVKLLSLTLNEVARTWPAAPRNQSEKQ